MHYQVGDQLIKCQLTMDCCDQTSATITYFLVEVVEVFANGINAKYIYPFQNRPLLTISNNNADWHKDKSELLKCFDTMVDNHVNTLQKAITDFKMSSEDTKQEIMKSFS